MCNKIKEFRPYTTVLHDYIIESRAVHCKSHLTECQWHSTHQVFLHITCFSTETFCTQSTSSFLHNSPHLFKMDTYGIHWAVCRNILVEWSNTSVRQIFLWWSFLSEMRQPPEWLLTVLFNCDMYCTWYCQARQIMRNIFFSLSIQLFISAE